MYLQDTAAYLDLLSKERTLEELFFNAFRTIKSVYLFKHFEQYVIELLSDENDHKGEVYWNASYYERLIDHIKISVAFETYNKAILLSKGILVHKIKSTPKTRLFYQIQIKGTPVIYEDFVGELGTNSNEKGKIYLNGLNDYFKTINYSQTLDDQYQNIIGLDKDLIFQLKRINEKRNRLHFFTEEIGAFEVNRHIEKWRSIMVKSLEVIEKPLKERKEKRQTIT